MIAALHHPSWVFVDTGGYFALTSSRDQNHTAAVAIMRALIAGRFRRDMTIVRVTQDDEGRARQIIARYDDKSFSLTDATSFAIMDRLGITRAFSFDANFSQYGLTVLTPASFR